MSLTKVHVRLLWRHPLHPVLAWELHGMLHLHWRNIKSIAFWSDESNLFSYFLIQNIYLHSPLEELLTRGI